MFKKRNPGNCLASSCSCAATTCGTITFTIRGCNSALISGATVTVYDGNNNTFPVLGTGSTNSSGVYAQPISAAKTYFYQVSKSRYTTATGTIAAVCTGSSSNVVNLTLAAATGFCCNSACADPIPSTLFLVDEHFGTVTLTCSGTTWTGCVLATSIPNTFDTSCSFLATRSVPVQFRLSGSTLRVLIGTCFDGSDNRPKTGSCPSLTGTIAFQDFTADSFACSPVTGAWHGAISLGTGLSGEGVCWVYAACSGQTNAAHVWHWTISE